MKKIIVAGCVLLLGQIAIGQVKIATKGSWNFASAKAVYNGVKQSTDINNGFGLGVTAKVPFDGLLHFNPSVMVNKRGFIIKPDSGNITKEQYSITYVDLIPSLSMYLHSGKNQVSISLGPNFGFTKFGNYKTTDKNNVTTKQKIKFGYGGIGWVDLGLNASVGYHLKKVFFELNYLHGLSSINNNEEFDKRNIRNRVVGINFGYYFK